MEAAMKTRTIIALAATLMTATTASTPAAEAGMGVRLGFGGPLGSFVARPTSPGAYQQPAYASSRASRNAYCAKDKKRAMAAAAARREAAEEKAERRRELMEEAQEKAERRRKMLAAAKREKLTTRLAKAASSVVKSEASSAEKTESEVPTSVVVAKANAGTPDVTPTPAVTKSVAEEPAPVVEERAPVAEATVEEPKPKAKAKKRADKALDCKKFVPTAGITISVSCTD
jgi:hypothetical protein